MLAKIDLTREPFSCYGSYLSIMRHPTGQAAESLHGDVIYLRGHRTQSARRHIAALIPTGVDPESVVEECDAACLKLTSGDAQLRIFFETPDTIRVVGHGMGMRIDAVMNKGFSGVAYPQDQRRWVMNLRPCCLRLGLDPICGRVDADAPWLPGGMVARMNFEFKPDAEGKLDVAIDYFQSTWKRAEREDADTALIARQHDIEHFMEALPPAPTELAEARATAGYNLWSCTMRQEGFFTRPQILMSRVVMDQVWSWDHCFNAMALAESHPRLAWDQLMGMFDHQDEHGALPDAVNPMFRHYNFSKPPVHGWALLHMMRRNPQLLDDGHKLQEAYDRLAPWSQWWLEHRRSHSTRLRDQNHDAGIVDAGELVGDVDREFGDELPHYLHGNDSGWDNSTMFDQGTPLVAPDIASLLALQLESLAELGERLGKREEAAAHQEQSRQLIDSLISTLWRDDHFVAKRLIDATDVESRSLIPLIPVVLGRRLPAEIAAALVRRIRTHLTDHGLATEHVDSDLYNPNGYWRGPIWAPPTMLIVDGLRDLGEDELANEIARKFCHMCAKSGMAENFDAKTGAALCDTAYTWTSSVFLLLAEQIS